jgi:manganese/zinc/iron transport system permease protein
MTVVSITAVGAFSAVGSILVVALMIAPPATAYLLAERLPRMLALSALIAALSAAGGYGVAYLLDVSIAGSMAAMCGALFAVAFLLAPRRGLIVQLRRRTAQRLEFGISMLLVHLLHHEHGPEAAEECRRTTLNRHLRWSEGFTRQVVRQASARDLVEPAGELVALTTAGRDRAQHAVVGRSG